MIRFPNCKINLGLYVTSRRADGYHNIESIFYPVALHDVLEIVPAAAAALHTTGVPINGDNEHNLAWKACHLLKEKFVGSIQPLDIYLHKVIPMGAGLGGGSADGTHMLLLLNEYFNLQLSQAELAALALQLGSDCPFFIHNTPQFASGRGEVMQPVAIDLSQYSIQLVCPGVHISTAQAFNSIRPKQATTDLRKLQDLPLQAWKAEVTNDFEDSAFDQYPYLAEIKNQLYRQGALYASMSGSGSSIYGIFKKGDKAEIKEQSFYVM